jgi:hypothetical protein
MKTRLLISLVAASVVAPSLAFAQASTATGAVGGAAAGAVVGGPVGAVVGGTVGAVVGSAAEPPREVITYVQRERLPSVAVQERVVVGEPLPTSVQFRAVPNHTEFGYAVVNNQRVIVEPKTRKVIKIVE